MNNHNAARRGIRVDSRGRGRGPKKDVATSKKDSSYRMSPSDKLVAYLVGGHGIEMNHAMQIVDLWEEIDWTQLEPDKEPTLEPDISELRDLIISRLGEKRGMEALDVFQQKGVELSKEA